MPWAFPGFDVRREVDRLRGGCAFRIARDGGFMTHCAKLWLRAVHA